MSTTNFNKYTSHYEILQRCFEMSNASKLNRKRLQLHCSASSLSTCDRAADKIIQIDEPCNRYDRSRCSRRFEYQIVEKISATIPIHESMFAKNLTDEAI